MARETFISLCIMHQLCPFLVLFMGTPALVTSQLDYCNMLFMGLPLKLEMSVDPECSSADNYGCILLGLHNTGILQAELASDKLLGANEDANVGPSYLRDCLLLWTFAYSTFSHRESMLQIPCFRSCHLMRLGRVTFCVCACPFFLKQFPHPRSTKVPTLFASRKALRPVSSPRP